MNINGLIGGNIKRVAKMISPCSLCYLLLYNRDILPPYICVDYLRIKTATLNRFFPQNKLTFPMRCASINLGHFTECVNSSDYTYLIT